MTKAAWRSIEPLIEEELNRAGIELVEMQYRKENEEQFLRFFIDRETGVDLELCTRASRLVKPLVDGEDLYYDHLEVSSPGIDRVIKKDRDFARFTGERVTVKMLKQYEGPGKITGVLKSVTDKQIVIETGEETKTLARDMVSIVRLYPDL
ncbi:MAG: ribosome maturation factor RimP [Deltaproteobacteria bacterium]